MITRRSAALPLGLAVVLATPLALLGPASAALADTTVATVLHATVDVTSASHGGRDVTVTAEPGTGRIQVSPYYWDPAEGGRYLHVVIGTLADGACTPGLLAVVDTEDFDSSEVYDAEGTSLGAVTSPTSPDWSERVVRLEVDPFAVPTCVSTTSSKGGDPASPGPTIRSAAPKALKEASFNDREGIFPASVTCPSESPAGEEIGIDVGYTTDPGDYPAAGIIPRPSGFDTIDFAVTDGGGTHVVQPAEPPSDVDLWSDDDWSGQVRVMPDEGEIYTVDPSGSVAIDGTSGPWHCYHPIALTFAAPTGWEGSLAGTTWWHRGASSNSGIGRYLLHRAYTFVDDTWVVISGEYDGTPTAACTTVSHRADGCHRYYYDAATHRLQIDDRRAKPMTAPNGWQMPTSAAGYEPFASATGVRGVRTKMRIAYRGKGIAGRRLVLRKDGSYRCVHCGTRRQTWKGSYRFLGGARQALVLRRPGHDVRVGVQLYVERRGGNPVLRDVDTTQRLLRFRGR